MLERLHLRQRRLCLAIAPGNIALVHSGERRAPAQVLAQWSGEPLAAASSGLPRQVAEVLGQAGQSGHDVRVVLADTLVRNWTVQPPENASRLQDCEAAAALRFSEVFGESPADWHISAAFDAQHAFLACALPRTVLQSLLQVLQAQRLRLLSLEPECVALWNHWQADLPHSAWLGICTEGSLVLGLAVAGRMQGMRRLPIGAGQRPPVAWLEQAVQREAARLNLAAPTALGLCGQVPSHWLGAHAAGLRCTALGSACDARTLFGVAP